MDQLWRRVGDLFENLYRQADAAVDESSSDSDEPLSSQTTSALPTQPLLSLVPPQKDVVICQLIAVGASEEDATDLCRIHCDRASDLAERYQTLCANVSHDVSRAGRPSSSTHVAKLVAKLQKSYNETLLRWMDEMVTSICALRGNAETFADTEIAKKERTRFNQDFLPYLEAFFERNQFPSRADKAFLAKKSSMSFRQIHVWFQNRRSRCKKEGKPCNARPTIEPVQNAEQAVMQSTPMTDVREDEIDTEPDEGSDGSQTAFSSRCSSITLGGDDDPFHCEPRSYTFPSLYPPKKEDYPFPDGKGTFTFAKPVWARRCSTFKRDEEVPDIGDVIENFKRLTIRASEYDVSTAASPKTESYDNHNVLAPITTWPPSAPLPSLIRRVVSCFRPIAIWSGCSQPAGDDIKAPPTGVSVYDITLPSYGHKSPRRKHGADPFSRYLPSEKAHPSARSPMRKPVPYWKRPLQDDIVRRKPAVRPAPARPESVQLAKRGVNQSNVVTNVSGFPPFPLQTSCHDRWDSESYFACNQISPLSFGFPQSFIASDNCLFDSLTLLPTAYC